MTNIERYLKASLKSSKSVTKEFSTSFSLGIRCLGKDIRDSIYSIYGFVRVADEIVDTFFDSNQEILLDEFESATKRSTQLAKRPPNDILLELYSLYKQANEGDVVGERPGFADFEGRAKYDSWKKLEGKSKEDAKRDYIRLVEKLEKENVN